MKSVELNFWQSALTEDMHVHSTFSDGLHSPAENIRQAEQLGLQRFCCVDHVRRDTTWLGEFVAEVNRLKATSPLQIFSGIETKLLNQAGDLDMPDNLAGVDFVYVADHQFPLGETTFTPSQIKEMLAENKITSAKLFTALVEATANSLDHHPRIVIAHLFSILPKIGLSEEQVPEELIAELAAKASAAGAQLEVDERWKCPSARTVEIFMQAGVPIRFSTDSHRKEKIGLYKYNLALSEQLSVGLLAYQASCAA